MCGQCGHHLIDREKTSIGDRTSTGGNALQLGYQQNAMKYRKKAPRRQSQLSDYPKRCEMIEKQRLNTTPRHQAQLSG